MKRIIMFTILFMFFTGYVWGEDFCLRYSPVWYNGFSSSQPSFEDLKNFINNTNTLNLNGQIIEGEHSVYLPYGTTSVRFAIAHHTTVATYLMKIDGVPSATDVDITTSPHECIRQYKENSTNPNPCPYINATYDLYGGDFLIKQVKKSCPSFNYPNLICSHPDTLWQGKTFNAVENTAILTVPNEFWDHHPKGAWLVYSWRGGVGGNAISITVDKNAFDSWYDSLSEEEKQSLIICPLNNNSEDQNNNQNNNENNNEGNNQNNNNDQNATSGDQTGISTISFQIKQIQDNTLRVTFLMPEINGNEIIYTYRWDFGDGTSNSTTVNKITHEYKWDDIIAAGNSFECKVSVLDEQNSVVANDSILILGLKGKIRTGALPLGNDSIVEIDNPWKLLLWIKKQ